MKITHLAIIFAIITVSVIIYTDIRTNNLSAVIENKNQIDAGLDTAIDDGVTNLAEVDVKNNIIIDKKKAVKSFFMSLYSSFGILADKDSQTKLNLYVPVIAVKEENGYYIFFSDEYTGEDDFTYTAKRWSEKYPYYYEDEDFIYSFTLGDKVTIYDKNNILGSTEQRIYSMDYHDLKTKADYAAFRAARPGSLLLKDEVYQTVKRNTIINCLEETMTYYTSRHNKIAIQNGITYNFSLPPLSEDGWTKDIDNVSMYVVFQGYPYGSQPGEAYNKIATAGAKVTKRDTYYIEQKGWYLVYHKSTCPELQKDIIILNEEPYYDPIACIRQGAYQCPICTPNGVFASDYDPLTGID